MNKAGVLNAIKEFRFPAPIHGEVIIFTEWSKPRSYWTIRVNADDIASSHAEQLSMPSEMLLEFCDEGVAGKLLRVGKLTSRFLSLGSSEVIGYAKRWQADGSSYLVSVLR